MKTVFRSIAAWISSGLGSGYASVAPGTFGSIAAFALWWLIYQRLGAPQTHLTSIILALLTIAVGTLAVSLVVSQDPSTKDPQWIVIDEWAGLFVSLLAVAPTEWIWALTAFVLFRILDATKLGPVAWAEELPGAFGIMADDLVAGAITAITIVLCRSAIGI